MADNKARKICYVFTIRSSTQIIGCPNLLAVKYKVRCNNRDKFEAVQDQLVSMYQYMYIEEWFEGEHLAKTESGRFLAFTVKMMKMINPTCLYCRVFVRNLDEDSD
ncbi:hypothetical protein HNY73_006014 [Argiope bruennichi]|uniref:Uncharacterized protein n=1 Tax=Argiope bruennichi TaxID=94029 RepID=A0A8T0FIJ6_ARGBR|nr:hypothetical protein HNY73_006014 [Argiope bruennichi]KAF8791087.1 hypothetical protein HNY73_006014 [Argiope bruennichi]